jgi:site-specific recombinase XerD
MDHAKLSELIEPYARHLKYAKNYSPRTEESYLFHLNEFAKFLGTKNKTSAISQDSVRLFLQHQAKKWSASTQAQCVSALKNFFAWLEKENGQALVDSEQLVRPKLQSKLIHVFNEDDLSILKSHLATRPPIEQLLFLLLYGSALRISEAKALTFKSFDLQNNTLKLKGKGSKLRAVPLTRDVPRILNLLKCKNHPSELIFKSFGIRSLRRWVEKWGRACHFSPGSKNLHPHQLRHSIATHLLRRGAKIHQIQKFLGHEQLETTERYTHLAPADLVRVYDKSFPEIP